MMRTLFVAVTLIWLGLSLPAQSAQPLSGVPSACTGLKGQELDSCVKSGKRVDKAAVDPDASPNVYKAGESPAEVIKPTAGGPATTNVIRPRNPGMPIPLGQSDLDPPVLTNIPVTPRK